MKGVWLTIYLLLLAGSLCMHGGLLFAQEVQNATIEQQLENLAEAEEAEPEDDSYYQQLQAYRMAPINLNMASETDLQPLRFLTDFHIQTFLQYRRLLGPLLNIYELQAIPGWDIELISRIRPFVKVESPTFGLDDFGVRLRNGEHSLLIRIGQILEKSKGYLPRDSLPAPYAGSQQRLFVRYKYSYKNLLQFGLLGEKDPGEQFFKGAQQQGFDFYSFHVFGRNLGIVKHLAIGDFTVNLGQGLLAYQSMGFRKSVDVMNIKRQTEVMRAYNSAGEANFFRGAGGTLGWRNWSITLFASRQKVSANTGVDSVNGQEFASSILTSGLHRTANESEDRGTITQSAVGGRLQFKKGMFTSAVNAVHFSLSKPVYRAAEPYNRFYFNGNKLTGFSGELSYTWRNLHAFGELAANPGGAVAAVAGILASVDPRFDFSLLYRNIERDYASLYSNAFTESTSPMNERGLFTGFALKPNRSIRLDVYADVFSFPWLRYRVNRPSTGKEFLVQLTWKPNKMVEAYSRLRFENKAINYSNTNELLFATENVPRHNWRTQLQYRVSPTITLRARTEMVWYDQGGRQPEQGFMAFADIFYKTPMKPIALNMRLQYFETDGYNSRIYAYENDVLFSYSIPPVYDKGFRGYFNINYDLSRKITVWCRMSRTVYPDRTTIGSGNDQIPGNKKTDYRFQCLYRFSR